MIWDQKTQGLIKCQSLTASYIHQPSMLIINYSKLLMIRILMKIMCDNSSFVVNCIKPTIIYQIFNRRPVCLISIHKILLVSKNRLKNELDEVWIWKECYLCFFRILEKLNIAFRACMGIFSYCLITVNSVALFFITGLLLVNFLYTTNNCFKIEQTIFLKHIYLEKICWET